MDEREKRRAVIRDLSSSTAKWGSLEVAWQSLRVGMYGVWCTLSSAATSTFTLPYEQAVIRDDESGDFSGCSVIGFGRGFVVGMLGLGLKPVVAMLDTLSYAFQSVAIVSSRVIHDASDRTRMRPPRFIDEDSGLVVPYVRHEAEGRRLLRKCGDVPHDYVYHLAVASIRYHEKHVVCLTTRHIMMIDKDQFRIIWKERLEHVKEFDVYQSEITLKINRSVREISISYRSIKAQMHTRI